MEAKLLMEHLLKPATAFTDSVVERFHPTNKELPGFPLMWPTLAHIRILPSELSVWAGINGHGKSLILNQVVLMAAYHKEKTAIASFEMKPEKTLYRMIRQLLGVREPSKDQINTALAWLDDYVVIYDYVGRGVVSQMLQNFTVAAETEGCTQFVIDSLMKCGLAEDDYSQQKFLVEDFHNFAMKTGGHVHLVAHARKSKDEGEKPGKMDVSGSAGITNIADNVYTVWRNKPKEAKVDEYRRKNYSLPADLQQANDAVLECVKSREMGSEVERKYGLWYDIPSMQYCDTSDRITMDFGMEKGIGDLPL